MNLNDAIARTIDEQAAYPISYPLHVLHLDAEKRTTVLETVFAHVLRDDGMVYGMLPAGFGWFKKGIWISKNELSGRYELLHYTTDAAAGEAGWDVWATRTTLEQALELIDQMDVNEIFQDEFADYLATAECGLLRKFS